MVVAEPALPEAHAAAESARAWAMAHRPLAELLEAGLSMPHALARFGQLLLEGGQAEAAATALVCAVALEPTEAALWTRLGLALRQTGAAGQAVACFERSLRLTPDQSDVWLLLGMAKKQIGDLAGGETAYRTALERDPDSALAWQCLGLLLEERREYAGAIDCLLACLQRGGAEVALLANLGKLFYQTGQYVEACAAFAEAVARDGGNAHYREQLGMASLLGDLLAGATVDQALERAVPSLRAAWQAAPQGPRERSLDELLGTVFGLLAGFGHLEAAARVGKRRLELSPQSASNAYLLGAVLGEAGRDRSPPEYIVEHFDAFADTFDTQLCEVLGYDIPERLCSAIRDLTPPGHLYDVLDAGCGTGLCGPLLRPIARTLVGADLSPKMLDRARLRGVYDRLEAEELIALLARSPSNFDLLVAADVLVYFGDLTPLFEAAAVALRPGGLWAFTTELYVGDGYLLQPSGRFAHSVAYVRRLAAPAFTEHSHLETTVRLEGARRAPGSLFLLRRAAETDR